jgi:predicted GNAT family acetyltransferase
MQVRFLVGSDFEDWLPLRNSYVEELHLTGDSNPEQLKARFERSAQYQTWRGFFEGEKLISTAGLNSKSDDIGQVGGVSTPRGSRMRGYSKVTILHLLKDYCDLHGHTKSILFTGRN